MKIIFDDVDELIGFLRRNCPGDILPYPKTINKCPINYDYDPITCEKCWTEECTLEVKSND